MYFLAVALCLFVYGISGSEVTVEDGISVLSDSNFIEFVKGNDFTFVEFYAPWCGHCKSLAPVFVSTAASLKEANANVVLAKVDCTQQKQICAEVQGYPTIKLYTKEGKVVDYDGDRTEEAITAFISKRTGPPSTRISTAEALASFLEGTNSRVVAYIDESDESEYTAWKEVASSQALELFSFAHVDSSVSGAKPSRTIELTAQGKETVSYTPESDFSSAAIISWISEHGFPLVETLSQEAWNRATSHPTSKFLAAVFYDKNEEVPPYVEEIASQFKGTVIFTTSDSAQILERWGGSGTFLPSAVVLDFTTTQPSLYTFDESGVELSADSLKSFIQESVAGTYKTNIKSEPIPAKNDEPVRTLVAKNFEQVLADPANKVILVEFYAPWCGHCKKLAPVLDELGKHFEETKGVIIAKFDATANTVRKDIKVEGFPTILLFKNGESHTYSGGHDLTSLTTFVEGFVGDISHDDL
jgi:protein disulfide-isomerase A1